MLANLGYDIWLANARGNKHSRNHTRLNPDKNATFWDFTFADIAEHDLPAGLAYVAGITQQKVHYVGHSQGTIIMHIALAEQNPVVLANLDQYFAFGPVLWVSHANSSVVKMLAHS